MSAPAERSVEVNGLPCRVWEKGSGPAVAYLAGFGGAPRWPAFLDSIARSHRVVVPSLPGFPGALGHDRLDDVADWVSATLDLLEGAGCRDGVLIGSSVGGMLAAEAAVFSPGLVRRLVLCAPLGIFDASAPVNDVFAQRPEDVPPLLCARPEAYTTHLAAPEGEDPLEWTIVCARASEAAARLLWPLGDRGLAKRLHRIVCPTLILWGGEDRVVPSSYARRFAERIRGETTASLVEGAGHLLHLDAPEETARRILEFLA